MKKEFNNVVVELAKGNIANQNGFEAIVNAANAELKHGGGVAGAIHRSAGPQLAMACAPLAPIMPGEAVITPGFNLPNKFVVHTLGPVYGVDKPESKLLQNCYVNSLLLAEKEKIDSIVFPAISTGAFGYPIKDAAMVAMNTIIEMTARLDSIKIIRLVLYDDADLNVYEKVLFDMQE